MSDGDTTSTSPSGETEITLGLLSAVQENSAVTQRSMASHLGIALGLANAYLKRCVKKGLIKVKQIPPNRYAYYLTPQGFTEKTRLTAEYLSSSFTFFRRARSQCAEALADCRARRYDAVALWGVSELAEIAALTALEHDVRLLGVVDRAHTGGRFAGLPVAASLAELGRVDAVLVTDLRAPQAAFDELARTLPAPRILTPRLLGVARDGGLPDTEEATEKAAGGAP